MAYTKNTWTQNDLITAEKLNNIEEGVSSNGILHLTLPEEAYTSINTYIQSITEEEFNNWKEFAIVCLERNTQTSYQEQMVDVKYNFYLFKQMDYSMEGMYASQYIDSSGNLEFAINNQGSSGGYVINFYHKESLD